MTEEKKPAPNENQGDIVIYQTDDGDTKIDVRFVDETVWLTQQQMAELFQSSRTNIVEHIQHIYEEGELDEASTCRKFRQVRAEGNRQVVREIPYYNLDMIISLGYRIKSKIATNFRRWATERLKEYMVKGFTMDDERLKNLGGGSYWKELRILNGIVSGYFDFAEVQAMRHRPMYMSDYVEHLDSVLSSTGEQVLSGAGRVSHKQAMDKANREYQRFILQNPSPVEEAYLQTIKELEKTAKTKAE